MNYPPIYTAPAATTAVRTLLGSNPLRLYPRGKAPQGVSKPYAVYQLIYGSPENYVNQSPDIDQTGWQVDVYAESLTSLRGVVQALRDVYEDIGHVVRWGAEDQDPETKNDHQSFDVEFLTPR